LDGLLKLKLRNRKVRLNLLSHSQEVFASRGILSELLGQKGQLITSGLVKVFE